MKNSILKENAKTKKRLKEEYNNQVAQMHKAESDLFIEILNDLKQNGEATARAIANKYDISMHEAVGNLLSIKSYQNNLGASPNRMIYEDYQNYVKNNKIETVKAGSRIYVEIDEETNEIIWRNMFKTVSRRNLYRVTEKQE